MSWIHSLGSDAAPSAWHAPVNFGQESNPQQRRTPSLFQINNGPYRSSWERQLLPDGSNTRATVYRHDLLLTQELKLDLNIYCWLLSGSLSRSTRGVNDWPLMIKWPVVQQ